MIRVVVHNVADNTKAAAKAASVADVLLLNEARTHVLRWLVMFGLVGWGKWRMPGSQNVIAWRTKVMGHVAHGGTVLLQGGKIGLGRSKRDRRRRGPSRQAPWSLLYVKATGHLLLVIDPHLLARTTTTERWRWPLMLASLARLRALVAILHRRYPGVPMILAGDGNLPTLGQWHPGRGWKVAPTAPDYGRRHYTQVYFYGQVDVKVEHEMATDSDHDAVVLAVNPRGAKGGPA